MRFYRKPVTEKFRAVADEQQIQLRGDEYIAKLESLRQKRPKPGTVVIVGAGIAGLSSGFELKSLGYNVIILEADPDHVGGRVRTFRESEKIYGEFGAMRIPTNHTLTRKYINDLKLELREFVYDNPQTYCSVRNQVFRRSTDEIEKSKVLFNVSESEKDLDKDEVWAIAVLSILDKLESHQKKDLFSTRPSQQTTKDLDKSSLVEAFHRAGISEEATEFVITHYGLETYLQTSLAEHLREEQEGVWSKEFSELVHGTDSIARKLHENLKDNVLQSAEVIKILNDGKGVQVFFKTPEGIHDVKGDWVICTAPLGVVVNMDIPGISDQKRRAIRRVNYDSSTKVLAVAGRRFWELDDNIFGGGNIYDGPLGHTWFPSDNSGKKDPAVSNSESMFLASYTWGQAARRIDAIPQDQLQSFITSELKKIHTTLLDTDIKRVYRWSWTEHPWSRGAFAFFNPGEHQYLYRFLKRPEGRIVFAGEHCSLSHSWIQGALESAIDATNYIVDHN